jgi:hypothetical protein
MQMRKPTKWLLMTILINGCLYNTYGQETNGLTMEKVLEIGKNQRFLNKLVGDWNVEQRVWSPNSVAPIAVQRYKAKRVMVGNFLQEIITPADTASTPWFERNSYLSYNNATLQWEYIVIDTRYPIMMFETGIQDSLVNGSFTTYLPAFVVPPGWAGLRGGMLGRNRRVFTFDSERRDRNQQYWLVPGGKEFLAIEYSYTRR